MLESFSPKTPETERDRSGLLRIQTLALGVGIALSGCMQGSANTVRQNAAQEMKEHHQDPHLDRMSKATGIPVGTLEKLIILRNFKATKRIDARTGEDVSIAINSDDYHNYDRFPEISVHAGTYEKLSPEERAFVDAMLQNPHAKEFHTICRQIKEGWTAAQ